MMTTLRFSIVIPTRDRADTLQYTLRTCLAQKFESYEIVIADNCSSPETKKVIDTFDSKKVRYVRSNIPLAMSDNWEFGVSHAKGEFIIVLGDDDGLLRHSLKDIDNLLQKLGTKVLRWNRVYYHWPGTGDIANQFFISFGLPSRILNSNKIISKAGNGLGDYTLLPMLYTAAIHRDLITQLKQKCGRVFTTATPDVSSGFNIAALVKKYPSIGRPMSINGLSAASNGLATIGKRGNSSIADEFRSLNEQAQFRWHPKVPNVYAVSAILANSFLQSKEEFFPHNRKIRLNRKRLVLNCLLECQRDFVNLKTRETVLDAIRRSLEDDSRLLHWFDKIIMKRDFSSPLPASKAWEKGLFDKALIINAQDFGITNVDDAAQFYEALTNHSEMEYKWSDEKNIIRILFRRLRKAAWIILRGN